MKKNTFARIGFSLPFLIPLLLFWILPLLIAFAISFTDWDYISPNLNFVGLSNYNSMIIDLDFKKALVNTFIFAFGTIVPTIGLGFLLALLFEKEFLGSKFFRSILFSPWITPAVAVSMVWSWIYEPERGFANHFLNQMGFESLQWLQSRDTAMLSVIIFTVWKSAQIDGAGYFKKLRHITLPFISPTTFFLFIVNLIQAIQVYDQIQIMTQGGPGGSTTTLLYLYYEKSFENFQMGPANAVAMVILVIIIVLSLASNKISSKWVHYE